MRRALPLVLAALCGCSSAPVVAVKPGYDFAQLGRVALLDFEDLDGRAGSGKTLSRALEPHLLKAGYRLVERSRVQAILSEQSLARTGAIDPKTVAALGRILGVGALVLGSATGVSEERSDTYLQSVQRVDYQPVYRVVSRRNAQGEVQAVSKLSHYDATTTYEQFPVTRTTPASVGLSARLVDVVSGEVLWSGSSTARGASVPEAADQAAERLMKALRKAWPHK